MQRNLFIGKTTLTLVERVSGSVGTDGPEALVEDSSSGWLFLVGGPSSSLALETSPKRYSNNSHRPEVHDPTREAAKQPHAYFLVVLL